MKVTLRGTRGSIGFAGPTTVKYGGDTASVEVRSEDGRLIILDAGSGVRSVQLKPQDNDRIDILLTHLHMDHVQGLPFFPPLISPDYETHVWGPVSMTSGLRPPPREIPITSALPGERARPPQHDVSRSGPVSVHTGFGDDKDRVDRPPGNDSRFPSRRKRLFRGLPTRPRTCPRGARLPR